MVFILFALFISSIFKAVQYWNEHRFAGAIPATLVPFAILAVIFFLVRERSC